MPSLTIPESGLSLSSGKSSAKSDLPNIDIITLTLADSVIEDMIKCVRNRKPIQLSLGNDPKITYGSQVQNFTSTPDPFPCDYFRTALFSSTTTSTSQPRSTDNMSYLWGSSKKTFTPQTIRTVKNGVTISQTMSTPVKSPPKLPNPPPRSPTPATSPTEGVDAALAALKSSLASEDARKKDNITKHVKDTSTLPPAIQQRGPAKSMKDGNKARFLSQSSTKPHPGNAARSMPTSPALTGINSPALGPTSVPLSQQQAERTKAMCKPIIHKLALGPTTPNVIRKFRRSDATEQEFKLALDRVADMEDGKWKMKPKPFRDLDVFNYKGYTPEERQVAIDNAIQVYDKIRLATSEPEWERLLPIEERGTGKCLSKLQAKIAVGAIKPAKAPRIKVHGAEDSGRDTPTINDDNLDDLFGEKIPTTVLKSESMVRSHSNPPVTKQKKNSEKEQQTKRLLAKGKPNKPNSAKSSDKKSATKESSKVKSSEFVRESDEEDDYNVPTTKVASVSDNIPKTNSTKTLAPKTKPTAKRSSRVEAGEMTPKLNGIQKPKVNNTSPPKSSPLASSPPTNASDFDDSSSSSSTSLKRKATDSSSDMPIGKRHQKSSSNSTSSSVASSNSIVNGERLDPFYFEIMRREVSATKRFVIYYNRYADLYRELAASQDKDRDVEKMADLMAMHDRLAQMKAEILPHGETGGSDSNST